jgi:hypothetical protein
VQVVWCAGGVVCRWCGVQVVWCAGGVVCRWCGAQVVWCAGGVVCRWCGVVWCAGGVQVVWCAGGVVCRWCGVVWCAGGVVCRHQRRGGEAVHRLGLLACAAVAVVLAQCRRPFAVLCVLITC